MNPLTFKICALCSKLHLNVKKKYSCERQQSITFREQKYYKQNIYKSKPVCLLSLSQFYKHSPRLGERDVHGDVKTRLQEILGQSNLTFNQHIFNTFCKYLNKIYFISYILPLNKKELDFFKTQLNNPDDKCYIELWTRYSD